MINEGAFAERNNVVRRGFYLMSLGSNNSMLLLGMVVVMVLSVGGGDSCEGSASCRRPS